MRVTLTQPSEFIVNLTAASIRWGLEDLALKSIDPRLASHMTKTHNGHPPDVHTHTQLIEGAADAALAHCRCCRSCKEFTPPAAHRITTGSRIHNLLTISESSETARSRYLASFSKRFLPLLRPCRLSLLLSCSSRAGMFVTKFFDGCVPEMELQQEDKKLLAVVGWELQQYIQLMDRVK